MSDLTGFAGSRRRRRGEAFSVSSLFANGEVGVWYDPSDLTPEKLAWVAANPGFTSAQFLAAFPTHTLYQNSTGTTPVTALGQSVGLVLDKSRGALSNIGAELVTNGTFSDGTTGWSGFGSNGWDVSNNTAVATSLTGAISQDIGAVAGRLYRVQFTIVSYTTGTIRVRLGGSTNQVSSALAAGSYTYYLVAESLDSNIYFSGGSSATYTVDNISVRAIPGNHARQTTDAARPTVQARSNLLTGTTTLATQTLAVLATQHTLSFTGTGTVTLSGTSTAGPLVGTGVNDRVSLTFTPTAGNLTLTVSGTVTDAQLERNSAFTTYQRVTTATDYADIGLPRSFTFDGIDDSFVTAGNVNFSGTDKMTVCAGVFKGSDAAFGTVAELTADPNTTAGSFVFGTSASNGTDRASWLASVRGATGAFARQGRTYAAPITNVVTTIHNIAGTSYETASNVRVNGAAATTYFDEPAVAGPTGGGNFSSNILYVGRRNQATQPFNGRIHQLIVRGAATDSVTIQQTERFVAQKTGIVL